MSYLSVQRQYDRLTMTHALFLTDIGISHKTTTQNENVYTKGAQGLSASKCQQLC